MDTRLIRTPHFYRQLALSLGKALTFSLNLTCSIWIPVDADNRHLFPAQSTDSHRKSTSLILSMALTVSVTMGFDCIKKGTVYMYCVVTHYVQQ